MSITKVRKFPNVLKTALIPGYFITFSQQHKILRNRKRVAFLLLFYNEIKASTEKL